MTYGRKVLPMLAVASLSAIALAACGGGSSVDSRKPDDASGGSLEFTAKELSFDPPAPTVSAGVVKVTLKNIGVIEHDFTLEGASLHVPAAAGKTASGSATLSAGSYTFFCSVPGHREAGMEGTLTVS